MGSAEPERDDSEHVISFDVGLLRHSWPIWEQSCQFELGKVLNAAVTDLLNPQQIGDLNLHHAGCWECDLSDDSLIWSGGVYDLFGLPRSVLAKRSEAVGLYTEDSRAKMERLRAHTIKHRRGFTLDVEIRPVDAERRRMRLIAAPIIANGRVVRLHGLKLAI
jgi:PAS domain-containing protein